MLTGEYELGACMLLDYNNHTDQLILEQSLTLLICLENPELEIVRF